MNCSIYSNFPKILFFPASFSIFSLTIQEAGLKKNSLLFIILLSLFQTVYCQNNKNNSLKAALTRVDSLNTLLKSTTSDTIKAKIYVLISNELIVSESDTVRVLCEKVLEIIERLPVAQANQYNVLDIKANAFNNLGLIYQKNGDIPKALEFFKSTLKISEEIGNKTGISGAYNSLGSIFHRIGDIQKALENYKRGLKINEEIDNKLGIANSLYNVGHIYGFLGNTSMQLDYLQKSLGLLKEIGDDLGIASTLNTIGAVHQKLGNFNEAINYYSEGLIINEKIGNKVGVSVSLLNTGVIYKNQGNIAEALENYQKGLTILQSLGNKAGISVALNNIAGIYSEQGLFSQAEENFKQCLKNAEEMGDKTGIAHALFNMAVLYKDQKNVSKSLDYHLKSVKIRQEIGDKKGISASLNSIGGIYSDQDSLLKAEEYFSKGLRLCKEMESKQGVVQSLNKISANLVRQKKIPDAKSVCKQSLNLSLELNLHSEIKNAATQLYKIYLKESQPDSAYHYLSLLTSSLKESLNKNYFTFSEREKESYFATMERDFMRYYDYTALYNKKMSALTDTAYNILLVNKGLSLKSTSAMRMAVLNSNDTLLIKEYEQWLGLKKKITKLNESGKDTKKPELEAGELEKRLVKNSNVFSDFEKVKNMDWKEVRNALKKGESAIEFIHYKSDIDTLHRMIYAALIIKPQSQHPEMITLFDEAQLIKILGSKTETGDDYITGIYGKQNAANAKLYNLIWSPLEKNLKGIKTVYYSPSGLLHKISIGALNKNKNVYLCDNYRLELKSSTAKLVTPETYHFTDQSSIAMFGDIRYDTPLTLKDTAALLTWPYLEGTKTEAEKVVAILKSNNIKTIYSNGFNASEEEFKIKAPQNEVVHIATHGFFFPDPISNSEDVKTDKENQETAKFRGGRRAVGLLNFVNNRNAMMRSGLVFAGANEVWVREESSDNEDGVLTAQEVATMDLRKTDLVVLSACETGLGDIKGTEGVYGLQRSLKMAGVKYIIMSLWQVPDAETAEFMEKFYTKLMKTKDIKTSFYQTQKEMRKKYDPFYWAAFVLLE